LKHKTATRVELLFEIVREQADSDEFFIQKAIGWALREYAKTDADAVRRLVEQTALRPLSRREALKHL
jgi:3-methyladenine DNA glycosylase AlkD